MKKNKPSIDRPIVRAVANNQSRHLATPPISPRHPSYLLSAETVNQQIAFRARELANLMGKLFMAEMRKPSQFHHFMTGANNVATWRPTFPSAAAVSSLAFLAKTAESLAEEIRQGDAELVALFQIPRSRPAK